MEVIANVYSTVDYSLFKKLKGNREVMKNRKKLLMESISERGWIRNPIVVNERMEIIDGQGRFEALKELGMPIEFVVAPIATIQDCIHLNMKQKNWSNDDYIASYAENGIKDYELLALAMKKYTNLSAVVIQTLLTDLAGDGVHNSATIKSGKLKIADPDNMDSILSFASDCFEIIGSGNGRVRTWGTIIRFIYKCDKIDCIRFLEQLRRHRIMLSPIATLDQGLLIAERIYNYNKKTSKVYFAPEYEKMKKQRSTERKYK